MDHLSCCPKLDLVLGYLPSRDVIVCMRVNKQICSTIQEHWDKMQKEIVKLSIDTIHRTSTPKPDFGYLTVQLTRLVHSSGGWIELSDSFRITQVGVEVEPAQWPWMYNKFGLPREWGTFALDFGPNLVWLLRYLLPKIRLDSIELKNSLQPFTEVEEQLLLKSFRDFYSGSTRIVLSNHIDNPIATRLSEHLGCFLKTNHASSEETQLVKHH